MVLWKFNAQFHMLFFFISLNGKPFNFICMCVCVFVSNLDAHSAHMIWMWVKEWVCTHHFLLTTMCRSEFHLSTFSKLHTGGCNLVCVPSNTHLFRYKMNESNYSNANEFAEICFFIAQNFLATKNHHWSKQIQILERLKKIRSFANLLEKYKSHK